MSETFKSGAKVLTFICKCGGERVIRKYFDKYGYLYICFDCEREAQVEEEVEDK